MPELLYCPKQNVPSDKYRENYEKIEWKDIKGETSEEEKAEND